MDTRTGLSTHTADMPRFHPPRICDRMGTDLQSPWKSDFIATVFTPGQAHPHGWEGLLNSSWFDAYDGSSRCYRRSLSWKMHYKTQLLKGIVFYYLFQFKLLLNQFLEVVIYLYQCHFKSLLNRIINGQCYWTCYDNPLSEFFLRFYFSSSKPHERHRQ